MKEKLDRVYIKTDARIDWGKASLPVLEPGE